MGPWPPAVAGSRRIAAGPRPLAGSEGDCVCCPRGRQRAAPEHRDRLFPRRPTAEPRRTAPSSGSARPAGDHEPRARRRSPCLFTSTSPSCSPPQTTPRTWPLPAPAGCAAAGQPVAPSCGSGRPPRYWRSCGQATGNDPRPPRACVGAWARRVGVRRVVPGGPPPPIPRWLGSSRCASLRRRAAPEAAHGPGVCRPASSARGPARSPRPAPTPTAPVPC